MRPPNLALTLALVALSPAIATADDAVTSTAGAPVAAGAALGKPVSTKKIAGLGTASVYATKDDGGVHYSLVIAAPGGSIKSPVVDFVGDCGMHKCDSPGKATPKLRAITVGGKPAAALQLTVRMTHETTNPDTGKTTKAESWQRNVFLVCNDKTCLQADFGTRGAPCTASLSATGDLTHACQATDTLAF